MSKYFVAIFKVEPSRVLQETPSNRLYVNEHQGEIILDGLTRQEAEACITNIMNPPDELV